MKPLVAMTAHASRPSAAQTATTPPAGHFRSAELASARVSAVNLGTETEGQGAHRERPAPGV